MSRWRDAKLVLLGVLLVVAGWVWITAAVKHDQPAPRAVVPSTTTPTSTPFCKVQSGPKPDPICTPGEAVADLTTAELCAPGWATQHRNVTARTRAHVLADYGNPPGPYELDHLIPLELGGTNNPANLWPEPGKIPNPKDKTENSLHRAVCAGRLSLVEAQRQIVG